MKITLVLIPALMIAACSHAPEKKTEAENPKEASVPVAKKSSPEAGSSIEAKQVAAEEQATFVTEISFRKGQAKLSAEDQARLKKILDQAIAKGKVDEVESVAWADSEYPSVNTKKLPVAERKLADRRNKSIEDYLRGLNQGAGSKVKSFNMAERPNAMASLLGTPNARIKKSLETAGIPNTDTSVKTPSKASKAIVMIILKD